MVREGFPLLKQLAIVMRLYWPKATPPSIIPAGEGTWKAPALQHEVLK